MNNNQEFAASILKYKNYLVFLGHIVVSTNTKLWINVRKGVYQLSPPFNPEEIKENDVREFFHKNKSALVLRYFTVGDELNDNIDTILYISTPPYDFSMLGQKARNQTRRGLERVSIKIESLNGDIEEAAYQVYAEHIRRLNVFNTDEKIRRRWEEWIEALRNSDIKELWCAYDGNEMVAFALVVWTPWGVEIGMQRFKMSASKLYPNNALIYTIANSVFDRGAELLSFGLSRYGGGKKGLDHFKKNMNFKCIPLKENYVWNPVIRPFLFCIPSRYFHGIYRIWRRLNLKSD